MTYIILCYLGFAQGKTQWARFEKSFTQRLSNQVVFIYIPDHQPDWEKSTDEIISNVFNQNRHARIAQIVHSAGISAFLIYQRHLVKYTHPHIINTFIISPATGIIPKRILNTKMSNYLNSITPNNTIKYYIYASSKRLTALKATQPLEHSGDNMTVYVLYGVLDALITGGRSRMDHELQRLNISMSPNYIKNIWPLHNPFRWTPSLLAETIFNIWHKNNHLEITATHVERSQRNE